jgi:alpha-D-xyloside xylohydrolase
LFIIIIIISFFSFFQYNLASNFRAIFFPECKARAAAFQGFWDGYGKYGIKTVWFDAAEPEHNGASMEGHWRLHAGSDGELMMGWNQLHTKMLADGFAAKGIMPEDYFILPRSAWVGSWRYSAALWSGDIESSFAELAIQIRVAQGTLLSGVALWTTDIGGYQGGDPADPEFQELIVRWLVFAWYLCKICSFDEG